MNRFIGREKELSFLEEKYSSKKSELVVIYGRRRIGKTETIKEFCREKNAVLYTCTQAEDRRQLRSFSAAVSSVFRFSEYVSVFEDWERAFLSVKDFPRNENGKSILVVDEFPYMVMENAGIPSVIQKLWDGILKDENVMIILCGSAMSFMEKKVLSEKNPLYGRATGIYRMGEMPFYDAVQFLEGYTPQEKMTAYGICGGVPYYLEQFDTEKSLEYNIVNAVLKKGAVLYSEPEFLLKQELREPMMYNSIISSIASGKTKFSEILDDTMTDKGKLSVYLRNLIELGLVERELPLDSGRGDRTNFQRGIYRLCNAFFRFWYAFVYPNYSLLEFGDTETVYRRLIEPRLDEFISFTFEDVCIEYMKRRNMEFTLPFLFTKCGRWWNRTTEIDVICSDGKGNLISGECKYRKREADTADLKKHISKDIRDISGGCDVYYWYFSFNGFTDNARQFAASIGMTLVTSDDIFEFETK